jgi:hypothetical protein
MNDTHDEATFAANVYPKGVINPLAVVRRAGPLVPLKALTKALRKKPKAKRADVDHVGKMVLYPYTATMQGRHGPAKSAAIYPYIVG